MNHKAIALSLYKINPIIISFVVGILLILFYIFLAINTAFVIAEKNSYDNKADALASTLSGLEREYIGITSDINIDLAYAMGFEESLEDTIFITRTNSAAAFLTQ